MICITSQALALEEGINFKRISQDRSSLPILVSIFIFLELEYLHLPIELIYYLLNACLRRILGSQCLVHVALEGLFRHPEGGPL